MTRLWKQWTATVPAPFLTALLLCAAFMLFVAWDQSHWWQVKEDYGFGWLVPAFVGYVVYERWPRILAALAVCAEPGSPRATGTSARRLRAGINLLLWGGALVFIMGSFYRAGMGSSAPGTFTISLGVGVMMLPLLLLAAPGEESARGDARVGWRDDARVKLAGLFVFPAFVWLVSAPMISIIETNLSVFMLNRVAAVVFFVFDILGLAIERRGSVLHLPLGEVGVADACSGIRSLTACLFAGSFLSAIFLDSMWKKVGLVASAIVFAFLTNLLRSLFLTAWAYHFGPDAIEGMVHDVAGYAVLGLTVIGLLCLLPLFNLRFVSASDSDDESPTDGSTSGARP